MVILFFHKSGSLLCTFPATTLTITATNHRRIPTTQCHAFCQTLHVLLVNYSKREVLCNDDHKLLGPRGLLPQFEEPLDVCRHKKPRLVGPPTTPLTHYSWATRYVYSLPTPPPTRLPFLVSLSHIHNSSLRKEQSEVEPSFRGHL